MLLQAAKDLEESKLDSFHLVFNDLVERPKESVQKIYKQFGFTYSEEYDRILTDYIAKNGQDRDKVKKTKSSDPNVLHAYSPAKYGLTKEQLSGGLFKEYIEKFNIPLSIF